MYPISMTLISEEKASSPIVFWVLFWAVMVVLLGYFVYSLSFLLESRKSKHRLSDRAYYKRESYFHFTCAAIAFSIVCPFLLLVGGAIGAFGYSKQTYRIQGEVEETTISACEVNEIFDCKPGVIQEISIKSVGTVEIKDGATNLKPEDLVTKTISVDCHYHETKFGPFGSTRDLDLTDKCNNIQVINDSNAASN